MRVEDPEPAAADPDDEDLVDAEDAGEVIVPGIVRGQRYGVEHAAKDIIGQVPLAVDPI